MGGEEETMKDAAELITRMVLIVILVTSVVQVVTLTTRVRDLEQWKAQVEATNKP